MPGRKNLIGLVGLVLVIGTLACNLSAVSGGVDATALAAALEATLAAQTREASLEVRPSATPTPEPAAAAPIVRVSVDTNCRTGPGADYEIVGGLLVGEQAEIVALSSMDNFVIIELPDGSGRTCWLWMQYGTQEGSTEGLTVATPPPTPTGPAPGATYSFNAALDDLLLCDGERYIAYRVANTGGGDFESFSLTVSDLTGGGFRAIQGTHFATSSSCGGTFFVDELSPGSTGYLIIDFEDDLGGHTLEASIRLCSRESLEGTCIARTVTENVGFSSDVNAKENFAAVDNQQILERLLTLPITSWTYIDQAHEGRHIGPMAQDFNPLFGVGEYENLIQVVDTYGVAFAAIQALAERNEVQAAQLAELEAQQADLQARLDDLEGQGPRAPWVMAMAGLAMAFFFWILAKRKLAPCQLDDDVRDVARQRK